MHQVVVAIAIAATTVTVTAILLLHVILVQVNTLRFSNITRSIYFLVIFVICNNIISDYKMLDKDLDIKSSSGASAATCKHLKS